MKITNNYIINFQNYFTELAQINTSEPVILQVRPSETTWARFSNWCNEPVAYKLGRTTVTEPKALLLASVCGFLAIGLILYLI